MRLKRLSLTFRDFKRNLGLEKDAEKALFTIRTTNRAQKTNNQQDKGTHNRAAPPDIHLSASHAEKYAAYLSSRQKMF